MLNFISADNRRKAPRNLARQDFSVFNQPDDLHTPWISPQLSYATFQFLYTCKIIVNIPKLKFCTLNYYVLDKFHA